MTSHILFMDDPAGFCPAFGPAGHEPQMGKMLAAMDGVEKPSGEKRGD